MAGEPLPISGLPAADPLTGAELYVVVQRGRSKKSTGGPVYDIGASGIDQTAQIAALLTAKAASGAQGVNFAPGNYRYSGLASTPFLFDVQNATNLAIEGNGSILTLVWDPLNPDTTIPNTFRFLNCIGGSVSGFTMDMSPSIFAQGVVTAVTGSTSFTFQATDKNGTPNAAFGPAFTTADYFLQIVPSQNSMSANNQFDNTPGPIVSLGGGLYTFTPSGTVPSWITVGATVVLCCRKRGANPFYLRGCGQFSIDVVIRKSPGVAIRGDGNLDGLVIQTRAQDVGWMSCTGAMCTLFDGRGTLQMPNMVGYGLGDDGSNVGGTRIWPVTAFGAKTVTVSAWNTNTGPSNGAQSPQIGDAIEVWNPAGAIGLSTVVTAVSGLTVTFADNLPGGYDPTTWDTLNRSCVTVNRIGTHIVTTGAGRNLISQSHDTTVDTLESYGQHNVSQQGRNPASTAHSGFAGYKGNVRIGTLISDWVNQNYTLNGACVVSALIYDGSGNLVTTPSGFPPVEIGVAMISNNLYGGIQAAGVDINIGTLLVRASGALRGSLAASLAGANDLWAQAATITVGNYVNLNAAPISYLATAGVINAYAPSAVQPAPYISGQTYGPQRTLLVAGAIAANVLYAHPIIFRRPVTIDQLAARVTTGAASSHVALAIYTNTYTGTFAAPGTLVASIAGQDSSATGTIGAAPGGGTAMISAGLYWAATLSDGTPSLNCISQADQYVASLIGSDNALGAISTTSQVTGVTGVATYAGGFPATFGTPTLSKNNTPVVAFRAH